MLQRQKIHWEKEAYHKHAVLMLDAHECSRTGSSLLAVNVHELQLKVTDSLLVGRLKHECH